MFEKTKIVAGVLMIYAVSLFAQIKPSGNIDQDLQSVYSYYKSSFLKSTASGNYYVDARGTGEDGARCATQSEAHGYGMIIFALAKHDNNSKAIFDGMNQLRKAQPSTENSGLMSWVVFPEHVNNTNPNQTPAGEHNGAPGRRGSATDGDLDMAYALLLAYDRWGDDSYLNEARNLIGAIKTYTVHPTTYRTNLGDWAAGNDGLCTRPSDWMPGHFRAFYEATNKDNFWLKAADTVYALIGQLNSHNSGTGLVPDFATGRPIEPDAGGCGADEVDNFTDYSYNACRVPFRLALDYVHNQTPLAEEQINKISSWLRGAASSNPANIKGGYKLNGTPLVDYRADMPFVAPFASGMLADPANQNFLNETWEVIKNERDDGAYGTALQLLNMFLITGNWDAPFQIKDGKFPVTVTGGSGSGRFAAGETVAITAAVPVGRKFKNWTSLSGVIFADANSESTSFTMLEKAVTVTAVFEVTNPELAADLAFWENWEVKGNLTSALSVTPNSTSGIVAFDMQTDESDEWSGNYAWADLTNEFNIGDFNNVAFIEITYTSSSDLNFILVDDQGWSGAGLGFTYTLRASSIPKSITINLSEFYRATDWGEWADEVQFKNGDRIYIKGVTLGIDAETSAKGEVTKLFIKGLNVDKPTSNKPDITKRRINIGGISIANGKLSFNVPNEKTLFVRICDIRGRQLFGKDITLNSGVATLNIPTNLMANQTLILNVKGQNGLNLSKKMLVK